MLQTAELASRAENFWCTHISGVVIPTTELSGQYHHISRGHVWQPILDVLQIEAWPVDNGHWVSHCWSGVCSGLIDYRSTSGEFSFPVFECSTCGCSGTMIALICEVMNIHDGKTLEYFFDGLPDPTL